MKKTQKLLKTTLVLILLLSGAHESFPQVWLWAKEDGAGPIELTHQSDIGADADGNYYVLSHWNDAANITISGITLSASPWGETFYIAKYDSDGNFQWVRKGDTGGGPGSGSVIDQNYRIAVDPNGNSYIVGLHEAPVFINGQIPLTGSGQGQAKAFMAKFDTNGVCMFLKEVTYDGKCYDSVSDIAVDGNGDVYITGQSCDETKIGGTLGAGGKVLSIVGQYVAKFDGSGSLQWVKEIIVNSDPFSFHRVILAGRPAGGCNVLGTFLDTGYFGADAFLGGVGIGGVTLTSAGEHDLFLIQYDQNGDDQWVENWGSTDADVPMSMDTDYQGNIFVTGNVSMSTTIGGVIVTPNPVNEGYLAKLDDSGKFQFAKLIGGEAKSGLACADQKDHLFVRGAFNGSTATFDNKTFQVASYGSNYIAYYDADGNFEWFNHYDIGTTYPSQSTYQWQDTGIAYDNDQSCYVPGFGAGAIFGSWNLSSDLKKQYVAKLLVSDLPQGPGLGGRLRTQTTNEKVAANEEITASVYPNPTDAMLKLNLPIVDRNSKTHLRIFDSAGREMWRGSYQENIDVTSFGKGTYSIIVDGSRTRKLTFVIK